MKILLTGGGTIGSVSPLLSIVKKLREKDKNIKFLFLGTYRGGALEKKIVNNYQIPFTSILSGKFPRYFNLWIIFEIIFFFFGLTQSFFVLLRFKPDIILSAGSFVSVPVVWTGWFLGIPSLIHQQDVVPGLANKLMGRAAKKITVTFEKSLQDFSKKKVIWAGNSVREDILLGSKEEAKSFFGLEENLPTVLVVGGSSGALAINKLIIKSLPELTNFCQIIHIVGKNILPIERQYSRHHGYEFLIKEQKDAYAVSDLVVTRAGMGVLSELSALGKPAIIIPIPRSHQEKNAEIFAQKNAALVLNQKKLTPAGLTRQIKELLNNREKLEDLSKNIRGVIKQGAEDKIIEEIYNIVK